MTQPFDDEAIEAPVWLIETARQTYWDGRKVGDDANYVSDANEACRFARVEDAEIVRCWLLDTGPQKLRSTEHMFVKPTAMQNTLLQELVAESAGNIHSCPHCGFGHPPDGACL